MPPAREDHIQVFHSTSRNLLRLVLLIPYQDSHDCHEKNNLQESVLSLRDQIVGFRKVEMLFFYRDTREHLPSSVWQKV